MTQSMVETVARAICECRSREVDGTWHAYIREARFAIEAMRSIDSRALALILHDIDELRGSMRESNGTFRNFWNAAIDHALNENGGDE